jgi:hypothetical protein
MGPANSSSGRVLQLECSDEANESVMMTQEGYLTTALSHSHPESRPNAKPLGIIPDIVNTITLAASLNIQAGEPDQHRAPNSKQTLSVCAATSSEISFCFLSGS